MPAIFSNIESFGERTAIIDESNVAHSYKELTRRADLFAEPLSEKTGWALIETSNRIDSVVALIGACRAGWAVILTSPDPDKTNELRESYRPDYVYLDGERQWQANSPAPDLPVHPDLGLLLSTSGSSGKAKLVRLSKDNIRSNADSIIEYLEIDASTRAITALPIHYSFGLSILTSHLSGGASIVLTDASVLEQRFWQIFEKHGATSFSGVPRSFQLLSESGFLEKSFPTLKTITQAGGRLAPEYVKEFANYAERNGSRFFVMYGQTEASPRISYLPPERAFTDPECIGVPIPGGKIELLDDRGGVLEDYNTPGELCYSGPNVMMGYASTREELAKGKEVHKLRTGDIALKKPNGLYQIVGRTSRFVKLAGVRVGLDDVEAILLKRQIKCVAAGDDNQIVIAINSAKVSGSEVQDLIAKRYQIPKSSIRTRFYESFPLLPNGKWDYRSILEDGPVVAADKEQLKAQFFNLLDYPDPQGGECFLTSGGDSLNFLEGSILLEKFHGRKIPGWERIPFARLFEEHTTDRDANALTRDHLAVGRALAIGLLLFAHAFEEFDVWQNWGHELELITRAATPSFFAIFGLGLARIHMDRPERNHLQAKIWNSIPKIILVYLYLLILQTSFLIGQKASFEQVVSVLTFQDETRYSGILVVYGILYLLSPYVVILLERSKVCAIMLCVGVPWAMWSWLTSIDTDIFFLQVLTGASSVAGPTVLHSLSFVFFGYFLGGLKHSRMCRLLVLCFIALALTLVSTQVLRTGFGEFAFGITSAELRLQNHPAYYGYGILAACGILAAAGLLARLASNARWNLVFGLGENSIFAFTLGCVILNLLSASNYGAVTGLVFSIGYVLALTALTYDIGQPTPKLFGRLSYALQKVVTGLFRLSRFAAPRNQVPLKNPGRESGEF